MLLRTVTVRGLNRNIVLNSEYELLPKLVTKPNYFLKLIKRKIEIVNSNSINDNENPFMENLSTNDELFKDLKKKIILK